MTRSLSLFLGFVLVLGACTKRGPSELTTSIPENSFSKNEDPSNFTEVASIDIGDVGAAEITAFDPKTNKLFVVNNGTVNKIDVLDFSNPLAPVVIGSIPVAPYGGLVNSLDVDDGKLAAAIESLNKQDPGKVVVFNTIDHSEVAVVPVGSLPDMITYSPDGKFILTANEGEPNSSYTVDPPGTISIISVKNNYSVVTLDFSPFASQVADLKSRGLRIYGPGASFAQDIEPEYITVSDDSRTAWVTLQENNAIAKLDLVSKTITEIFPLGFKNYNLQENAIDPSDRPLGTIAFNAWPVNGMYQPDAIAVLMHHHVPYLFTANEGDAREYAAFAEEARVSTLNLDPVAFPNAATLKLPTNLGRLNVTKALGDDDGDGDYDRLFSLGARSFSVWNGNTGTLVYDSKNDLDVTAASLAFYDDDRSDNKSIEPEGLTIGKIQNKKLAFIGLERSDAVVIYDVTDPTNPVFLQMLRTGDAPEGVLFIPKQKSPNNRSLLVVSSENDGVIKVYMTASE